ncbi:hypothetical protein THOG11_140127 [Vibrio harveyi]|nr:hypothetical protein TH15OA1_480061 [Vibrio harveyi]CAH1551285.1 hypothetical protein THOD03_150116 [Vibrio harveyi]CAH1555680.1 hypothetical protein THOG11_140127 [Vibrio harveyi]CAK6712200.1 hypothetical protein HORM4_1100061 [Vibrio harveyi]
MNLLNNEYCRAIAYLIFNLALIQIIYKIKPAEVAGFEWLFMWRRSL